MSNIAITVETITSIEPHPNADKVEIAKILGTQVVVPIGEFSKNERVIYFPPDMLLPPLVSHTLGVQKYLKHSLWEGEKIRCRIAACRLRGVPSYGFAIKSKGEGDDVTDLFEARKYEPPVRYGCRGSDAAPPHPDFPTYTDIQHYWRYPGAIPGGTPVRITEKLHGTNCRVGVVKIDGEWQFVAGSHNVRAKPISASGKPSLYWKPLEDAGVLELLNNLCREIYPVIIYGEIYGPGIQDLDYGETEPCFRVFDIMVGSNYLGWDYVEELCDSFEIQTVPVLAIDHFSKDIVEKYTNGLSTLPGKSKFKGREGIVITPLVECWSNELQDRAILKSVSVDYLDRKGAQDNA